MIDEKEPTKFDLYKIALDTRNMEIGLFWQSRWEFRLKEAEKNSAMTFSIFQPLGKQLTPMQNKA